MSEHARRTFSVRFGDYINELPYAQKVADMYKTEHTVINVSADVEKTIEEALWFYEEPFADSSFIPTFIISREARKHVKVILSGEGGDELFAGYDSYWRSRLILLQRTQGSIMNYPIRLALKLQGIFGLKLDGFYKYITDKMDNKYYDYYKTREYFSEDEKKGLFKQSPSNNAFDIVKSVLRDEIKDRR